MATTQKALAEQLSVSQVTVSRALRGEKGVAEPLRQRIIRAAERGGYSIDASNYEARMMRHQALGTRPAANVICAIVYDEDDSSGFGGRILRGMNAEGEAIGSEIVMVTHCRDRLPLVVTRKQVDGAIRMMGDVEFERGIARPPVPWVSLFYDVPDVDVVTVDNFAGARSVGRLLCAKGHRRIAYVGPTTDLSVERLAGVRAAAAEAGAEVPDELVRLEKFVASEGPTRQLLKAMIADCDPGPGSRLHSAESPGGRTCGEPMGNGSAQPRPPREPGLDGGRLPFTALVAYNDYMAEIALQVLDRKGLRVPADVSVAGFDGILSSSFHESRRITSSAIPLEEVGAAAVRLLSWRLQSPRALRRRVVIETTLVEGDTIGEALR